MDLQTVRSQKLMRQFLSIHGAKLRVWERQWVQVERQILFEEYSPKDAEPDEIEYDRSSFPYLLLLLVFLDKIHSNQIDAVSSRSVSSTSTQWIWKV
jgi:hypothetical protein